MSIVIHSPYSTGPMPWHKGNLHAHTANSDGRRDPQAVIDAYAAEGYGFLMLSDHDYLTNLDMLDARGMALIPGNEISANGPHMLHVGARSCTAPDTDRQKVLNSILQDGGFSVMCHPNWESHFDHCPQDLLEFWQGYIGIEVYNGVIRRLEGSPLATDRWDRLLGLGRKVWGFANDDSHRPEDDRIAWNVVQCDSSRPEAIIKALRDGRFYASTGVTIEGVCAEGRIITVTTADAQCIVIHSDFGRREAAVQGREAVFRVAEDSPLRYVRFECWGAGDQMAWTQPFFVEQV